MTAAFQLCAEETGKLLMMLLILLLLQSRVLASTSKGTMLTRSVCNIKFSSCSVYKTTASYALCTRRYAKICKGKLPTETNSAQSPLPRLWKALFWISVQLLLQSSLLEHTGVFSASWLFSWCEWLNLPDISGDSTIYPSIGVELTNSFLSKVGPRCLVQSNLHQP